MTSLAKKIIIGAVVAILLGLFTAGILLGEAVYGWKKAQRAGNEAAALQNMKTIAAVETQYFNTHNRTFGTFDQLIKEGMLTRFGGDPLVHEGYVFTLKVTPKTTAQQTSYTLNADPESANTGRSHFYVDSITGSIHVNEDQPAGANDPPIGE